MNTKAYLAESLGTFLLAFAVSGSLTVGLGLSTPLIAGLTLGLCVYYFGSVSGSHLNPAISLMLLLQKKISLKDTVGYIVAQVIGATVAGVVALKVYGQVPNPPVIDSSSALFAEILGTFCLGLGVSSVANKQVSAGASGITVGGSLLLGILLASKVSNGVLNPAVAFGINSLSIVYILGPIIGAGLAGLAYPYLISKK
ncbi:MAG TPA: aquaporin [Candidatus Gracilibacteria bacterium]